MAAAFIRIVTLTEAGCWVEEEDQSAAPTARIVKELRDVAIKPVLLALGQAARPEHQLDQCIELLQGTRTWNQRCLHNTEVVPWAQRFCTHTHPARSMD